MLRLPRDPFVALYAAAVAALVAALLHGERLNPWVQFQRRWLVGVVGGVLLGALLAGTVLSQPRSPAPTGNALALALLWDGGVYGLSDGLHMNVLPVAEFRSSALVAPLIGNTMITVATWSRAVAIPFLAGVSATFPALLEPSRRHCG